MKSLIKYLLSIIFLVSLSSKLVGQTTDTVPYVIMLSMDAFRWDYPEKAATPNLDSIQKYGVRAHSLQPAFPSKTFPNHYTMVTGLYPDHHGLVNNNFYDQTMDRSYSIGNRNAVRDGRFYGGEPIWNTARKQGIQTASYFWVASEADIQGMKPSRVKTYEHHFPFEQRIDSVIAWLQLPEAQRPHLITWYLHEPDSRGHDFGPDSKEIAEYIPYLDSLMGDFMHKINALPIANKINIIITADHGMGTISADKVIYLNEHLPAEWIIKRQGGNPVFNLKIKENYIDSAYQILQNIPHLICWKADEVPEYLNYGSNPRVLDLIITTEAYWSVLWKQRDYTFGGTHGYDPTNKDMHAIFYAIGPAFKQGYKQASFQNVDLYNLIAKILRLEGVKNDGDFNQIKGMLIE